MDIFSTLRLYPGKWSVKGRRAFNAEELGAVASAIVVASEFGNSVCFHMKNGGQTFIPLSTNSTVGVGQSVDLTKAELITLGREGDNDITRVEV